MNFSAEALSRLFAKKNPALRFGDLRLARGYFCLSLICTKTSSMLGGDKNYFIGSVILHTLDNSGDFQAASVVSLYMAGPIFIIGIVLAAVARQEARKR